MCINVLDNLHVYNLQPRQNVIRRKNNEIHRTEHTQENGIGFATLFNTSCIYQWITIEFPNLAILREYTQIAWSHMILNSTHFHISLIYVYVYSTCLHGFMCSFFILIILVGVLIKGLFIIYGQGGAGAFCISSKRCKSDPPLHSIMQNLNPPPHRDKSA